MKISIHGHHVKLHTDLSINRTSSSFNYFQIFHTPVEFTINDERIVFPPNTVVLFQKNTPHIFRSLKTTLENSYVSFDFDENDPQEYVYNTPVSLSEENIRFYESLISLLSMIRDNSNCDSHKNHIMHLLLSRFSEDVRFAESLNHPLPTYTLKQLQREIDRHWDKEWKIEHMANLCGMSYSYFYHSFKKLFGVTPTTYIIDKRLSQGVQYLDNSTSTIASISELCGFKSTSYFIRKFKEKYSITPAEYRKNKKTAQG